MLLRKCFTGFALLLLMVSAIQAQSSAKNSARKEKEKKALALLEEVMQGAPALKLPENRIRLQLSIADFLWSRDETRARAVFKTAIEGLQELLHNLDPADPQYENNRQLTYALRHEIMQMLSQRDAGVALDFVRTTRLPSIGNPSQYGAPDPEAQLEIRLAGQIADKDPQEALRLALENLPKALDYDVLNLLSSLQNKDKALAATLAGAISKRLQEEDFTHNYSAPYMAAELLRRSLEELRAASKPANEQTTGQTGRVFDEQTVKALIDLVTKFMLNSPASSELTQGISINARSPVGQMYRQLLPWLPELERVAPSPAAALRKRWAEYEKADGTQNQQINKLNELAQSGTLDALLEAIPEAPPQLREQMYQQAAWKAMNNNEMERAAQIINEKITNPAMRHQALANLDRQKLARAGEQANLEEIRSLLPRLYSIEERVRLLIDFAGTAMGKNDKTRALQLLEEAQGLIKGRAESYGQLQAQLQLAQAFVALDSTRSLAILESAVEHFNELTAAAAVLNGFDLQYFKNGEMPMNGGNNLINMIHQYANELASLASKDFDRVKQLAERFQRNETHLFVSLEIAKGVLNNLPVEDESDSANK